MGFVREARGGGGFPHAGTALDATPRALESEQLLVLVGSDTGGFFEAAGHVELGQADFFGQALERERFGELIVDAGAHAAHRGVTTGWA